MGDETNVIPLRLAEAPLAYADERTDRQADLFSADREMTWRLARANGWAAVGIALLLGLILIGSGPIRVPGRFWYAAAVLSMALPLVGMLAPGIILVIAARRVRAGGRRSVLVAGSAGAWLACAWVASGALLSLAGSRPGRDWVTAMTPLVSALCLAVPAGKLVYHAVRNLSLGGNAGTRDRTSGLDVAVEATDEDLAGLGRRIRVLQLAGSVALLLPSAALLVATLVPAPALRDAARPAAPMGTPLPADLYNETAGLAQGDRQKVFALVDPGRLMSDGQRAELDDFLRERGKPLLAGGTSGWSYTAPPASASAGPSRSVQFNNPRLGTLGWYGADGQLDVKGFSGTSVHGDLIRVPSGGNDYGTGWSLGAADRWAATVKLPAGRKLTREQVEGVLSLVPVPQSAPPARLPAPRFPPLEGELLDDGTLRVQLPGGGTRYIGPDGAIDAVPLSQRRVAEAAAAAVTPVGKSAWLPVSPAWPLLALIASAAAGMCAWRTRTRRVQAASAACLAAAAAASALVVRLDVYYQPRYFVFISAPAALLILGLASWFFWASFVLPRRVTALTPRR